MALKNFNAMCWGLGQLAIANIKAVPTIQKKKTRGHIREVNYNTKLLKKVFVERTFKALMAM